MDIEEILNGLPINAGKTLYAEANCPCCGREWFARADIEVFKIVPVYGSHGNVLKYAGNVTCDNCNYMIEHCDLIDEEAVIKRCKSYTEED